MRKSAETSEKIDGAGFGGAALGGAVDSPKTPSKRLSKEPGKTWAYHLELLATFPAMIHVYPENSFHQGGG